MKINLKSLSQLVRQNLFESDALKRKTVKTDTSQIKKLEQMSKERHQNGMCKYAFRMTDFDKLGINPNYISHISS
jgi:hypothetical protein